ncbi:GIY-YIG nuclease family protein [soil metagenome]
MHWKWYVYIIECLDGSYYVGKTWKVDIRYDQHNSGLGGKYTKEHGVKKLVYFEEYDNFNDVSLREKQLKGWTREKKEKLITGVWTKQ